VGLVHRGQVLKPLQAVGLKPAFVFVELGAADTPGRQASDTLPSASASSKMDSLLRANFSSDVIKPPYLESVI